MPLAPRSFREHTPEEKQRRKEAYELFKEQFGTSMRDPRRWQPAAMFKLVKEGHDDLQTYLLFVTSMIMSPLISMGVANGITWTQSHWPLGLYWSRYVLFVGVVLLALIAHAFKRRNQFAYGTLEVMFGIGTAWNIALGIKPTEPMFAKWTALVGSIYFITRGLNNIHDARQKNLSKVSAPVALDTQPQ